MKIIYQQPTTFVIAIQSETMICGSIRDLSGITELHVSSNGTDEEDITEAGARRDSRWDDEDEEDE